MKALVELGGLVIEILFLMLTVAQPVEADLFSCSAASDKVRFACQARDGERVAICERRDEASAERDFRLELSLAAPYTSASDVLHSPGAPLRFNHYSRFQTEYLEIAARTEGFEYRVYRHYLGDIGEQEMSYGVVITTLADGAEEHLGCVGEVIDELTTLPPFLECDSANALGCGAYD